MPQGIGYDFGEFELEPVRPPMDGREMFERYGDTRGPQEDFGEFELEPVQPQAQPNPYYQQRYTAAGAEVSPALNPYIGPVMDAARGFNNYVATVIGAPPEVAEQIARLAGQDGLILDEPGNAIKAVRKAMAAAGMDADKQLAVSQFAADVGEEVFANMVVLAGLGLAAPAASQLNTSGLPGYAQNLIRDMGKALIARPGVTVAGDVGGIAGGKIAEAHGQNELVQMGGALLGGGIAGSIAATPVGKAIKAGAKSVANPVNTAVGIAGGAGTGDPALGLAAGATSAGVRGVRAGRKAFKEEQARRALPETKPLMDEFSLNDVNDMQAVARLASENDIKAVETQIKRTISSVSMDAEPIGAAAKFRRGVNTAMKTAKGKEDALWSKVRDEPIQALGLREKFNSIMREASPLNVQWPSKFMGPIRRISKDGTKIRNRGAKKPARQLRTSDLIALRGDILAEMRDPNSRLAQSPNTRRILTQMQTAILDVIEANHPDKQAVLSARAYSKWMHERFDEGPLSQFIVRYGPEALQRDDHSLMVQFLRRERGGQELKNISTSLDMPALEQRATDFIQNEFRKHADDMDSLDAAAGAGRKWLESEPVKRFMRAFPEADAKMRANSDRLQGHVEEWKAQNTSALARFTETQEPQKAIDNLFIGKNGGKRTREIKAALKDDPQALEAFKAALITSLWKGRTSNLPSHIHRYIQQRDRRQVLIAGLGSRDFARFERILNDAVMVETGRLPGDETRKEGLRQGGRIVSRIAGAALGRYVTGFTGGANIQTPGILAQASAQSFDRLFRPIPIADLFAKAVVDENWERVLYSKAPQELSDFDRWGRAARGLGASTAGILGHDNDE